MNNDNSFDDSNECELYSFVLVNESDQNESKSLMSNYSKHPQSDESDE